MVLQSEGYVLGSSFYKPLWSTGYVPGAILTAYKHQYIHHPVRRVLRLSKFYR